MNQHKKLISWNKRLPYTLIALSIILAVAILLFDLWLPLGVAGGVPYVAIVLLGWWFPKRRYIYLLAAISTILTFGGYIYSPEGGISWIVLTNRFLALFAIWVTAVLLALAKRGEEQRKTSDTKYRDLVETSQDLIWRNDREGRFTYLNPAWESTLGYTLEEMIGHEFPDFKRPEEREQNFQRHHRTMQGDPETNYETTYLSKTGEEVILNFKAKPLFDGSGQVVGAQGTATDFTEFKRVEEELRSNQGYLRTVVDTIPHWIFLKDKENRYTMVNRALAQFYGMAPEELLGMHTRDVPGRSALEFDQFLESDRALFEEKQRSFSGNELVLSPSGEKRTFRTVKTPLRDKEDNVVGLVGISEDITERKQLEAQFQQAQKMEAVGTLAGGIAHNFNNLLQVIMGNISQILLEVDSSHPHHEILTEIKDRVKSGSELTKQLLGFARGGKVQTKSTNLNTPLENAANLVGRTHKEIDIHIKLEPTPWNTKVDKGQIEQVLLNLFVNAWQAMPGGGELYVQSENMTLDDSFVNLHDVAPGRYVKLSVTDTGTGMEQEILDRIFEPFFTTKEETQGTGLGLASAYGIIKNHEGIITVDSEVGKGTTFDIYLPATEEEEEVAIKDSLKAKDWKGSGTILFVDDEEGLVNSVRRVLGMLGFDVLVATSGIDALEAYQKNMNKINLIILDMIMPGMGGGAVFDKLKELNQNVKVILSSGYSLEGEAGKIMDRGCDGFIQKPYDLEALSEAIHDVLDQN